MNYPLLILIIHILVDIFIVYLWLKNKPVREKVNELEAKLAVEQIKNTKKGYRICFK